MLHKPNFEIDYNCVDKIFACRSIGEIKSAAQDFIAETEKVQDEFNGMFVYALCRKLEETFAEWAKQYSAPPKGAKWNAVIIPPEHSPIMLLPSCTPFGGGSPREIITGLKSFIDRCNEFTAPKYEAISNTEIKKVLTAAQKAYGLIDIIAPNTPLKILCFANSHIAHNSQCGISNDPNRPSTIFVYHPKENDTYDKIFIFAHEIGHALHLALTGDIEIIPEGFEEFNEKYFKPLKSIKEGQEGFADAVAFAILNGKGLGTHFPTQFSKDMSPTFAGYLHGLISKANAKVGKQYQIQTQFHYSWFP
jgi:hypothetical protein